jgi:hypothetical protein
MGSGSRRHLLDGSTDYRKLLTHLKSDALGAAYRKLLQLRERVKSAEVTAEKRRARGKRKVEPPSV